MMKDRSTDLPDRTATAVRFPVPKTLIRAEQARVSTRNEIRTERIVLTGAHPQWAKLGATVKLSQEGTL
jgi:hypothetical protein